MNGPDLQLSRISVKVSMLILISLLLQALVSGILIRNVIARRALAMHQLELEEHALVLLPALQDSMRVWNSVGPAVIRQAELDQRMKRSFGPLEALSIAWVDAAGNLASVGYLPRDTRFQELKLMLNQSPSQESLQAEASQLRLPVVIRSSGQGWLFVAGKDTPYSFMHWNNQLWIFGIVMSAGCISAVIVLLLMRPIMSRFNRFSNSFHMLGQGHLEHRLKGMGRDELGMLAKDFNEMAARLTTMREDLAGADKKRRSLISDVSHELGAPLTNMRGYLEVLLKDKSLDNSQYSRIALCHQQAERLDQLIQDLLDLARLDDAGLVLKRQRVDMNMLIEEEIAAVELACLEAGIDLEWLPSPSECDLFVDGARIAQIVRNLLRNAVQSLGSAESEVRQLQVQLVMLETDLLLELRDTGTGIAKEDLERLFERYHRPHHRRGSGSGLGLCISRRLAELHQGSLQAASEGLGKGACFSLRIPLDAKQKQA